MDPGFLGAQAWPSGLPWYLRETAMGFTVGDPIAPDHKLQVEYMRGERCTGCRVMVRAY